MLFAVTYVTAVRALVPADRITRANGSSMHGRGGRGRRHRSRGVVASVRPGGACRRGRGELRRVGCLLGFVRFQALRGAGYGVPATRRRAIRPAEDAELGRELVAGASFLPRHPRTAEPDVLLSVFSFF